MAARELARRRWHGGVSDGGTGGELAREGGAEAAMEVLAVKRPSDGRSKLDAKNHGYTYNGTEVVDERRCGSRAGLQVPVNDRLGLSAVEEHEAGAYTDGGKSNGKASLSA
ncbi:hypothetical protein OsI_36832 [Oryza sativa Indica Group]|uniref:Uncharacterized protein n=1 Tax=Oryza sativa subsp. indica TaxID=39946 RepID=B8BLK1_ORYSI|nr:hypothetical protein OsI_36832 [Oryza sativa Indica Group]